MPFPKQINADASRLGGVDPSKDVDGFHPVNVGKLLIGERDGFAPCTPAGVQELLVRSRGRHAGKGLCRSSGGARSSASQWPRS